MSILSINISRLTTDDSRFTSLFAYFCKMKTAGDGTRALNFFIDTLLIFALALFIFRGWNFQVMYWGYRPYNFGWFFFGTGFLYYIFFEALFARTPAKWFTYSKVVNKHGARPSFGQILIRSLIRLTIIDLFFMPFLGKTLHDYLSKTNIVES